MNVQEKLGELRRLKDRYRTLEREHQVAKGEHDAFQATLYGELQEAGLLTLRTPAATFSCKSTVFASVQDPDAFGAWMEQNDLAADFTAPKPVMARLNELVRDRLDAGEELPPGLGWYPREYISITEN